MPESQTQADKKKPTGIRKYLRYAKWVFLGLGAIFVIWTTIFIINVFNNLPPLNDIENPRLDLSTQIYTADGQKLGSIHGAEDREYIKLD
ncbi:MAG: hypothetical protein AAF570_17720, partial [Bacteroidota bacterium]